MSTPEEEIYDQLMLLVDPGQHHERELTEFYDRLAQTERHPS